MGEPRTVSITFYNRDTKLIETHDIRLPTGTVASVVAARNAGEQHARATASPLFAIPTFVRKGPDKDERWLVFKMAPHGDWATGVLLRDWPTRAAAEMWMQHNGHDL